MVCYRWANRKISIVVKISLYVYKANKILRIQNGKQKNLKFVESRFPF